MQKWGNSAAIRLPVAALEAANLSVDQPVEIEAENGVLVIRPAQAIPRYSLDDLLSRITAENLNVDEDWKTDEPAGREAM